MKMRTYLQKAYLWFAWHPRRDWSGDAGRGAPDLAALLRATPSTQQGSDELRPGVNPRRMEKEVEWMTTNSEALGF
ncbi:hypothetical protein CCGE525_24810 (plasmid) [Rhizobium jaguaris]|uniref:Uncharacterized protein n=1 Tax=Rhizobium jaguaris TaxID=1312183 RepID=A0A387FTT5_9HYPH|nr:hypothetical protein CCGE525_24810 [Rhizobium jaguaris]